MEVGSVVCEAPPPMYSEIREVASCRGEVHVCCILP